MIKISEHPLLFLIVLCAVLLSCSKSPVYFVNSNEAELIGLWQSQPQPINEHNCSLRLFGQDFCEYVNNDFFISNWSIAPFDIFATMKFEAEWIEIKYTCLAEGSQYRHYHFGGSWGANDSLIYWYSEFSSSDTFVDTLKYEYSSGFLDISFSDSLTVRFTRSGE